MKEQILKLKAEGKRVCDIAKELGCTKQIIHYHLNPGYKDRHLIMQRKARAAERAERLANPKPRKQRVKKEPSNMTTERQKKIQKAQQRKELAKFKTVPVDNSEKVAVKLDHKTTVYAKPGYDLAALKVKYKIAN